MVPHPARPRETLRARVSSRGEVSGATGSETVVEGRGTRGSGFFFLPEHHVTFLLML